MPTRAEVADRRARALALRVAGVTWQQIADQLGHKTAGAAHQDVSRALEARTREMNGPPDEFTALELERLEAAERRVHTVLATAAQARSHVTVLEAIDRLVRISESRRRLVRERVQPAAEANPIDELRDELRARRASHRRSAAEA